MTVLGFHASHEQFPPAELLDPSNIDTPRIDWTS